MKNKILMGLLALLGTGAIPASAETADSHTSHPLSLGLQFGGNAFLYALGADYDLTDTWRVGAGLSLIQQADFLFIEFRDYKAVPIHADYTFHRSGGSSFYLSSGVTILSGKVEGGGFFDALFGGSSDVDQNSFHGFMIPIGVGWEYRGSSGFNFRISTYGGPLVVTNENNGETDSTFVPPVDLSVYFGWAFL